MTKTEIIKQHLINHKTITDNEAHDMYGVNRLSAIIFNLRRDRKQPMIIDTIWQEGIDRFGNKCRFGIYTFNGFGKGETNETNTNRA